MHLLPEFGQATVGEITREWVRDFLAAKTAEERDGGRPRYAPGTIHKLHTTLSSIFTEADRRGMVAGNPARGATNKRGGVVKPERREMVVLTPEEVHALADAIATPEPPNKPYPPHRTLILTAAFTGLRAGELAALRRRDVNLMAATVTVARAVKTRCDGQPVFGETKTGEPGRPCSSRNWW